MILYDQCVESSVEDQSCSYLFAFFLEEEAKREREGEGGRGRVRKSKIMLLKANTGKIRKFTFPFCIIGTLRTQLFILPMDYHNTHTHTLLLIITCSISYVIEHTYELKQYSYLTNDCAFQVFTTLLYGIYNHSHTHTHNCNYNIVPTGVKEFPNALMFPPYFLARLPPVQTIGQ